MLPLLVAAALAAAPLDAAHAALMTVMSQGEAGGCDPAQFREAAAGADITTLGRVDGSDVVLASVHQPCICGNVNCPYYVLRLDAGKPRLLYATYGIVVKTIAAAPLPRLVVQAHDSALVIDETTAVYRNGKYADQTSARVRADNGARKANDVPVRFVAGASSATLHGSASTGWYDSFAFDAQQGQLLTIGEVRSRGTVTITVFGPGTGATLAVAFDKPVVLPQSGRYHLEVEVASDADVPYALTLAIR